MNVEEVNFVVYVHRIPTKKEIIGGALNIILEEKTGIDIETHKIYDVEMFNDYVLFNAGNKKIQLKVKVVDKDE